MEQDTYDLTQEIHALRDQLDRIEQRLNLTTAEDLRAEWLTGEQAQEVLNIRPRTLQKYREERRIGFSQVGHKIYYRASDLQAHLERHYNPSKANQRPRR